MTRARYDASFPSPQEEVDHAAWSLGVDVDAIAEWLADPARRPHVIVNLAGIAEAYARLGNVIAQARASIREAA